MHYEKVLVWIIFKVNRISFGEGKNTGKNDNPSLGGLADYINEVSTRYHEWAILAKIWFIGFILLTGGNGMCCYGPAVIGFFNKTAVFVKLRSL